MLNFFERLREIRKGMNLTQADFGALAGVTVTAQLNYEKGTRNPDTAYLERLAAHGVDVVYLLTGERIPRGAAALSEAEAALIARYRSGSPALRGYLQVRREGDHAVLTVEDSGPGIAPEHRERAMQRFVRVTADGAPGSGLGLAIVQAIAQGHGATVALDSSARLCGLRVTVRFAAAKP